MKKVVIIDDDVSLTEALQILLAEEGYEVVIVNDDKKINGAISKKKPDLVVLDYRLLSVDGLEVSNRLRNNPETKQIPILMISASNNVEKLAREAGIDEFLAKPFDIETFLALVKKYCTD